MVEECFKHRYGLASREITNSRREVQRLIRGYKIRLFPTKEQEEAFKQYAGAARWVWNYMLGLQNERHENGQSFLSGFDTIKLLKPLKNDGEHDWLQEVSNATLQQACRDLAEAFKRFFDHVSGYPRFKSRKEEEFRFPVRSNALYFLNDTANIEKVGKVRYKTDLVLPIGKGYKFHNARISFVNGKWMLSFCIECDSQVCDLTDESMGIDLGTMNLATVVAGDQVLVFQNINKTAKMRRLEQQSKHLQRKLARQQRLNKRGSRNIAKTKKKLRRVYARMANIRRNYVHQVTSALVKMLPARIVMEDLDIARMMKDRWFSKAIHEACWGEFTRQMKYKCEKYGIKFVQADRFFPSSKTCSKCGSVKSQLNIGVRTYVCEHYGYVIDRDENAAINLSRYVA